MLYLNTYCCVIRYLQFRKCRNEVCTCNSIPASLYLLCHSISWENSDVIMYLKPLDFTQWESLNQLLLITSFKSLVYITQPANNALEMDYHFLMAFPFFFTGQVTSVSTLKTLIHAFSETLCMMDEVMV